MMSPSPEFNWLWGYFVPLGFLMLVWGGLSPKKARRITPSVAMAMAIAVITYWAFGFAFHLGGAYVITEDPALQGLQTLFSIVPGDPGWGVIGLSGFFLSADKLAPAVLALFLAYLPLVVTAVLLVTLALANLRRWIVVLAAVLTGAIVMPSAACWAWGSGWLAHLGETLGLGYGFVDFGGSGLVLWLPGMFVLPILLLQPRASEQDAPPPPATYAPLVANIGALLMGIGWLGWELSGPFHVSGVTLDWYRTAVNILLGMSGAAIMAQLYGWLATGRPETLFASQGLAAGWGTVLACAPFLPNWGALTIGASAGLLFPLLHYAVRTWLHVRDTAAVVSLALTSGPLGLLAIGVLSDGRWGQGWNGVEFPYQGLTNDIGVAGVFMTGNTQQLSAQLVGLVALGLWGGLWGIAVGMVTRLRSRRPQFQSEVRIRGEDGEAMLDSSGSSEDESPTSLSSDGLSEPTHDQNAMTLSGPLVGGPPLVDEPSSSSPDSLEND